jgi:hypothetical protein
MKLMSGVMKPFAGAVTAGLFLVAAAAGQASAETRGYVVSWFGVSTYFGGDSDCPDGLNPMSTEFYHRELLKLGYSEADATRLLKDFPGNPGLPDGEYIKIMMTRGDKKHNVYAFPETEADPGLKEMASTWTARQTRQFRSPIRTPARRG